RRHTRFSRDWSSDVCSSDLLVGLCPHLFCSPTPHIELRAEPFDADWKGGFFCPCHGSRFDLAGRVYQGSPASRNMQVPPYYYETDNVRSEERRVGHGWMFS